MYFALATASTSDEQSEHHKILLPCTLVTQRMLMLHWFRQKDSR